MKCPNCGYNDYKLGIACVSCGHQEEPREVDSEAADFSNKVGAKSKETDNKVYSLHISGIELDVLQEAIVVAASNKPGPELDVVADKVGLLVEARQNEVNKK